jgi:hypothetical protein
VIESVCLTASVCEASPASKPRPTRFQVCFTYQIAIQPTYFVRKQLLI